MNENLKKAGKIALIVVTPTVILLIVLAWYLWKKRQDKKKSNKEDSDYISCSKCDWSWKKSEGGSDLYKCHKCGHDNTPVK